MKRKEENLRDLRDKNKHTNICIIGVPEGEEREKEPDKISEKIIAENFPNVRKETLTQVEKAQRIPQEINPRRKRSRHILIKPTKIRYKEKNIKRHKGKITVIYKGIPGWITADLSAETLQARRECQDIFKVMKGMNVEPRTSTQQGSHSDLMERPKTFQKSKS